MAVIVGAKIYGVLITLCDDGHRRCRETSLRVTHGCRAGVQGAEVSVPIDQGHSHGEVLCHADHGVVDSAIAMWVELSHHLADHSRALYVTFVGAQPHLGHLIENSSLHRLETVTGIGEGAGVNDGVGVLQEGALHLGRYININNMADFVFHGPILTKSELNFGEGARLLEKWLGRRPQHRFADRLQGRGQATNELRTRRHRHLQLPWCRSHSR